MELPCPTSHHYRGRVRGHQHARDKSIPRNAPTPKHYKVILKIMLLPHAPSRPPHKLPPTRTRKNENTVNIHSMDCAVDGKMSRRVTKTGSVSCAWRGRVEAFEAFDASLGLRANDVQARGRRTVRPELTGSLPAVHHSQDLTRFLQNERVKKSN